MKKVICFLLIFIAIIIICTACDDGAFSKEQDSRFFEYILKNTGEGDVTVEELNAYSKDGYCYYHIKYSCEDGDGRREWNAVYRARFGEITMYYSFNWGNDSVCLPMKDEFYDAMDYGVHKHYEKEEIERYTKEYFENN